MYQKNIVIDGRPMMLTFKPTYEVSVDGYNIVGRGSSESEAITDFSRQLSTLPPFQKSGRVIEVNVSQKLGVDDDII